MGEPLRPPAAAEAARAVLGQDDPARAEASGAEPHRAPATASELPGALRQALDAFDEPAAQAILDRLMSDLQAVAGLGLLDKDGTRQVRARLTTIEATARQALAEMRRLLELLDDGEDGGGQEEMLRPTPGLGRLGELSGQLTASGLPVELMISGDLTGLPPGLDLAAYRIIQEALTNTIKHAGPAIQSAR